MSYKIRVTAITPCVIQDPFPVEGALSITVGAGETREITLLPSQYDRIRPLLTRMHDLGVLSYYVAIPMQDVTTADIELFVDGTNGDDVTGVGTAEAPFKTITAAYTRVPKHLEHSVHITIAEGTYADFPEIVEHTCGADGQISFEAALKKADPITYTLDSFDYGGHDGYTFGDFNVPTATWVPNALKNKYIHVISGASAGKIYGIISNTGTAIRVASFFYDAAPTDTFEIVEPSVVISGTPDTYGFQVSTYTNAGQLLGNYGRLCLAGIDFRAGGEGAFKHTVAHLSGVTFNYIRAFSSQFNYLSVLDPVKAFTNEYHRDVFASYFHSVGEIRVGLTAVSNAIAGHSILSWFGWSIFQACAARGLWSRVTDTESYYCYFDDRPATTLYAFACHGGCHTIDLTHFEGSAYAPGAVRIKDAASITLSDITCNAANIVGPGVLIGHECRVAAHNVVLSGVGGNVKFENSAAAVAWPAAGTRIADTDNSSSITGF